MSHSRTRTPITDESSIIMAAARERSTSRSRDPHPPSSNHPHPSHTSGRGGAGNSASSRARSASRDPTSRAQREEELEKLEEEDGKVESAYEEKHRGEERGSGRGGFGNFGHHVTATVQE